jgi:outer membrane protein OmpA-like peptidoglycan-associated protein
MRRLIPVLLALAGAGAIAAEPVRFVTCPVYRDTDAGRKSGCWLATDGATGVRYDVSDAPFKPWIGHMILVEGQAADTPDICGGVPLAPVRVAVLDETCAEVSIPAEGYPSKPSVLPKDVMAPSSVPRTMPPPPYSRQQYEIEFSFGDDRLMYQHVETTIERAALYASASKARKVEVIGRADTRGFNASQRTMREPAPLAAARAQMVKEALLRLGVPETSIVVHEDLQPQALPDAPPALRDVLKRRATIIVRP